MKYFTSRIMLLVFMATVPFTALNAHATNYIYDSLNRLSRVNYDNGSYISYTFDPAGNVIKVETYNTTPQFTLEGDVSGDGAVDLNDAILALQVLIGLEPSGTVDISADVNSDEKIGIEETIFVLRDVAGF